jgi:hypothetical protein
MKLTRHNELWRVVKTPLSDFEPSDYFDRVTVHDWFRKRPDLTNQEELEACQLDALSITMRFDPFPEDAANA